MFLATLIASHLLFVASEVAVQQTQDKDKEENGAVGKVYLYSLEKWNADGSSTVTKSMVENANQHCNKSYQECCLHQNWTTSSMRFTTSDVIMDYSGYPMFKRPYTTFKVGMMIPSGLSSYIDTSCGNQTYIQKDTVIKLIEQSRSAFSDKTEHYIIDIEEKSYPLPPNNLINYIMIPISVAIVLICIVVLLILMWKCGNIHAQYSKMSGPPEPVFKLDQMTATNSVTTTMTPTAVEVQVEPPSNGASGVKKEQQPSLENGNTKNTEDNSELIGENINKDAELNSQHNSGYDPAPADDSEAIDEIEKELANIN